MTSSLAFLAVLATAATPAPEHGVSVRVEQRAPFRAITRQMKGDYGQHAAAISGLLKVARASCAADGIVYGVYPQDPDAVPAAKLQWQLGYRMQPGVRCATARIPRGFAIAPHAGETVAILDATLGESKAAGLSLFHWLADSNYVQIAPTRMEYFGGGTPDTRVQIIVPVRKRAWAVPSRSGR